MARRTKKRVRDIRIKFRDANPPVIGEDGMMTLDVTQTFEVWIDGGFAGLYDTSPMGLIDFARRMERD